LDHFVVSSVHRALSFDGLISSHPIYVPVSGTAEIFSIFDSISYEKGGSVIRMMQFFLGDETFKRGMQLYITEKAYSVATHDDLWDALGRQSVKDGKPQQVHDVKRIMDTWTLQMNYPTVFMERIGNDIKLSQSRYLRDKNATDPGKYISTFGYKWEIPVTLTTQTSKDFNQNDANIIWMGKDGSDVLLSGVISGKCWYIGNIRQYGFYRVNYPEDNWIKLIDQLKMDHTIIHPVNRAQIINDAWNFAKSGDLSLNIALKTVEYLSMEDSYFPFYAANVELGYVRNMLERTELYGDFSAFMKKIFSMPLDRLGYNHTGSGHLETLLRSLVVEGACAYGDTNCINIAVSSFQNLMQSTGPNNPIDVDSRRSVYNTAIKYGGVTEWDFAYNRYKTHNVASERILMLHALSYSREVLVLSRFLQYTLTDDIRKQEGIDAMRLIGRNPIGRSLLWDFVRGNWTEITERFGRVSYLITDVTSKFNTEFDLQSLQTFKDSIPDLGSSAAAFDRAIETTRANIKWMDSNFQIIKDWLQSLN
ncbi:Hypothetical predicted protein, partial [Mytilus galloprovincialis]